MGFYNSTVLIMEDSKAVRIMLSQYIENIGFTKIIESETGKEGIEKFNELVDMDIIPLVFLGYHLPDMSAAEIIPIILSKMPSTKIILETSKDRHEESVRSLFSLGISHFIPKPLRFENMKQVISTIKEEFELNSSAGLETEMDKIRDHLKAVHKTSVIRIAQNFGLPTEHVVSCLLKLKNKGEVLETNSIKETLCSNCNSVNTSTIFSCPDCNSSNFSQTKLIEHYDCGAVHPDSMFENNTCPQCDKEIKALGVDYRVMSNLFICGNCKERFPNPNIDLNCIKCGNKFTFFDAQWINSPTITWVKESLIPKNNKISNLESMNATIQSKYQQMIQS
ncbi:MAG: response regulator [Nitrosopumilus sp.]